MDDAIAALKTTRPTFYRWLREGKLRGMKVGRQWRFERAEIDRFLRGGAPQIALRVDIKPLLAELEAKARELNAAATDLSTDSDVQRAVALLTRVGVALGASDLHLAPTADAQGRATHAVARYRVDGVLHPLFTFDARLASPIIEQWKVFVACDSADSSSIQHGVLHFDYGNRPIKMFICFVPASLGPTLTARLAARDSLPGLDLGDFASRDRDRLLRALEAPAGLIIVTGPAGSGKTTTLYGCLQRLNGPDRKIVTVEDPVECVFPHLVQIPVNEAAGVTYAHAARAALRSDADVLMIGELRDRNTAWVAHAAAMTGVLVLSTLHANDAAAALTRLVEMGLEPFVVADAVRITASHRLVRRLCDDCAEEGEVSDAEQTRLEGLARGAGLSVYQLPGRVRRPKGCAKCRQLGYRGRTLATEVLGVTPAIKQALQRGASAEEIRAIAVGEGMTTMAAHGVQRVAAGETSVDEIMRVLAH